MPLNRLPDYISSNISLTGVSSDYFDGIDSLSFASALRANRSITGGGTITFDSSANLLWSQRFIVISNGRGPLFSTTGYFDIDMPAAGTVIPGVGGASNKTVSASGISLNVWEALYYILPIGGTQAGLPGNFRVALYTSDLDVPYNWVLIAVRNGDTPSRLYLNNGIILSTNQVYNGNSTSAYPYVHSLAVSPSSGTDSSFIELGINRTGNGYAYIDLIGDTTYTDFGLRIIRNNTGANTDSQISHRGTGVLYITAAEAGQLIFQTTSTNRLTIDSSGTATFANNVVVSGDLTINGTTTNINTTNLVVEDKNIILGDVTTPSNTTADGGGITLKGATDKTFNWVNSTGRWTSNVGVEATSFVRTSGTASQFLKADGSVDSSTYITGNQSITLSGDVTGSGTTAITTTLANSGATAGTYKSVTVDIKGRVTAGTNPTTLSGYGITDAIDTSATAQTKSGTLTAASFIPTSSTVPTNGMYLPAANTLGFATNSTRAVTIDSTGKVGIGTTSPAQILSIYSATSATIISEGDATTFNILSRSSTDTTSAALVFRKARGTSASRTVVSSGDFLGNIIFAGYDGASNIIAGSITSAADAAPSTGIIPGRLIFNTADSAGTLTERMRIDSSGQIGIGSATAAGQIIRVGSNATGGTTAYGINNIQAIQSDVTLTYAGFRTNVSTQATAFTLSSLTHFTANQGTIGASSAITNQAGFQATSSLTGATYNYGFYGDIASGTNRYNFYANGTASNYFNGITGFGALPGGAQVTITNGTAANQSLSVIGHASQTGDILSVRSNGGSTYLNVTSSGNVGIGSTPSASYIFDIQKTGSGTSTGMRIYNSATAASSGSRIDLQQGAVNTFIDSVSNTTGRIGTSTSHPLSIISNNVERIGIDANGTIKFLSQVAEAATVSATAAATTVTYDVMTNKNVLYYTSNATADWTFNVRGSATVTLNTLMDIGQSLTVVFMNTNGTTAYRATAFQIDGTAVTPKWFGGSAPTAGNVSSIDVYTYNIIKTAASTYTVLASLNKFA